MPTAADAVESVIEQHLRQVRVSLLRTLSARFPGTPKVLEFGDAIQRQRDLATLMQWYEAVAVATSLDQVRAAIPAEAEANGRGERGRPSLPAGADWPDPRFEANVERFSPEALAPYAGQHVAWSRDGSQILASDPSLAELGRKLAASGTDPRQVVFDFVEPAQGRAP